MADYRSNWDEELVSLADEFFDKHWKDCTEGEKRALIEIKEARRRLRKLDEFLRALR